MNDTKTAAGGGAAGGWKKLLDVVRWIWDEYSIIVVTALIVLVCAIVQPRFIRIENIMAILRNSSIIGIMALGMTFVIITGGIDLSGGHILATAGTVLILLQRNPALPLPFAMLVCIVTAMAIGSISGFFITKANLPPFIVTLAIGIFFRSVTMHICRGATMTGRNIPEFTNIGMGSVGIVPIPLIVFLISGIVLGCVLKYTKYGSYVYAVGGNESASRYSGINTHLIKITVYMLLGLCIGISTVLDMSRMAAVSASQSGNQYEFDAITAVVVGGTPLSGGRGRIVGTMMGVFILGIVSNVMVMMNISPYLSGAVKGAIILIAVLLQKQEKA
jgi:ribose transport system permease protein